MQKQITINNPAGRLYNILLKSQNPSNHGIPAKQAWSQLLDVPDENQSLLLRRLAKVMELPSTIKELIEKESNIEHQTYLVWFPQINEAFSSLKLDAPFSKFSQYSHDTNLLGLRFCSDLLSRSKPEKIVEKEELEKLTEDVNMLINEIITSKVDAEVKQFALKHLRIILHAIQEYRIVGIEALRDISQISYGAIFTQHDIARKSINTDEGNKFWEMINRVGLLVGVAEKLLDYIPNMKNLLP